MENVFTRKDPLLDVINQVVLGEKKLTDAELKKREEIAQAIERENPGMDMGKKMAIATAQAKKVAEAYAHDGDNFDYKDSERGAAGVIHPDKAKHYKVGEHAFFYDHGTGNRVAGKVMKKDSKQIHIKHIGKIKKFKISRTHTPQADDFDESVEQIEEGRYLRYDGHVNGKHYSVHVPEHMSIGDYRHSSLHRKIAKENPHLHPHEVKAIVHSEGEEDSHVKVTHGGKTYTHHVYNEPEPDYVHESVEQIDELSKQKLTKYKKNAEKNIKKNEKGISKALYNTGFPGPTAWPNVTLAKLHIKKIEKRKAGIQKADSRLTKEEAEQIDEISAELATKVQKAHAAKSIHHASTGNKSKSAEHITRAIHASIYAEKRKANPKAPINVSSKEMEHKANKLGLKTEEVEQIDELSKGTLGKYISKAVVDVHNDAKWAGETDDRDAKNKAFKRLLGVKSAAARLSKQNVSGGRISNFRREEVDLEEQLENFWGAYLTCLDEAKDDASQQALLLRAMAKDPSDLMKMKRAIAMGDKALTNPVMRQEILKMLDQMMNLTVTDKALLQKTRSSFMKQKQFKAVDTTNTEEYVPEEVEELDELSKGTLNKYVRAAADGPTGVVRSKDMASRFSNPYVKDFMNNRAEKRIKGINTAMKKLNKLTKEEVEELDELSKDTLGNYIKKATNDVVNKAVLYSHDAAKVSSKAPPTRTDSDYDKLRAGERRMAKRSKGIDLAVKKLTKEEADKDAPFDGGREVKSSKPAAERVKKIAKGMQKHYTKDKK